MSAAPNFEATRRAEAARILDALQIIRAALLRLRTRGGDCLPEVAAGLTEARRALDRLEEVTERLYSG